MLNKKWIPLVLGFNGGYVDTAGFLALNGLFAAHVTGNFATLGAAIVTGSPGTIDKALALPVFCGTIVFCRLLRYFLLRLNRNVFSSILGIKLVLLILGASLAIHFGPFADGDSALAIGTGLIFVVAMAMQNAVHRAHLTTAPPSTVMTMTVTQVMLDIGDLIHGVPAEQKGPIQGRLKNMVPMVILFTLGCAMGGAGFYFLGMWCFAIPPIIVVYALAITTFGSANHQATAI
jgi:uncharacterized membrane protein YoaK (UPF0700 family)